MRLSQTPSTLLSLLLVAISQNNSINASPLFPRDFILDLGFDFLEERGCEARCGVGEGFCCSVQGQTACSTDSNNVAYCIAPTGDSGSSYSLYTTVWTETDLVTPTSTGTSWYPSSQWAPPTTTAAAGGGIACATGQPACGTICCASTQTCAWAGQCVAITSGASSFSAPFLVTSGGSTYTATSSVTATTTKPFSTPVAASSTSTGTVVASSSSNGLSGGAIAGIVIGVIAGIILLLLICFCCILKAGFDTLLSIFGLGRKGRNRRRSTERTETVGRYSSRHGSGASRREKHTGWFGSRPSKPKTERKKKSSGMGGFGAIGAGLLALAVILGLKRRDDAKKRPPPPPASDYSGTYYSDTYTGTSESSESSDDRRTRGTRVTGGSRRD